ncbi:unnamed protein product, partial [Closterium sp. NIES-53]
MCDHSRDFSPVVLTGHADASWVDDLATQRSSQGYTFSLGFGSVSWRSTRSSSVLSSSCEAEIYAGAMAAQELRWLTYLLTDLGEAPRSPPILYVDNKDMLALCQEHRLEHRTKHIALRYFLARELQQRGQLRLAYVASQANTADVFTKALQPCDHQHYYRTYCPILSRALASLVTDPRASLSSVSALIAAVTEFASTRCLDYATSLVAAPTSPLAVGGESALGCDALEDRQFELEFMTHWRLRQPVYGLRQAPREWHDTRRSTLSYIGFQPSFVDPSVFVRRGSTPFFVLVYVDDLVFATADRVALADVKLEIQRRHCCTDLGELRHYLGLQITRDRATRTITLSQSHMVQQVLHRFELQHSTVRRTPLAVDHVKLICYSL